jgi:UMF1 family MFS transporter
MNDAGPRNGRLGQFGWALYQFASAPYFVIVNIFVFNAYFQKNVVGDNVEGQVIWGYTQATAGVIIPILAPLLGALADAYGPRKPGLIWFSLLAIPAMLALWWVTPGAVALGFAAIVVAAVAMESASIYHNAMLTSVASARNVGFMSGLAYSLDYVGSVTMFILWLLLPSLGLLALFDGEFVHERLAGPLAVAWMIVFSIPLVLYTKDVPNAGLTLFGAAAKGLRQLSATIARVGHYRNVASFLVVRAIYADGMSAVFSFLAGYLSGVFGWPTSKIGIYALIVLTVPIFTSFIGGWIDDKIGSKRAIQISLTLFTLAVAGSISTTPDELLFFFPVTDELRAQQLPLLGPLFSLFGFTLFPEQVSLAFSVVGGAFVGPVLASSRTMAARIAPLSMISEVYGLYTLTGKATAFLAPFLVAVVTDVTQNQRVGFSVILAFLVAGLLGLWWVKEERAEVAPEQASPPPPSGT